MKKSVIGCLCLLGIIGIIGCRVAEENIPTDSQQPVSVEEEMAEPETDEQSITDRDGNVYETQEAFLTAFGFEDAEPFYEFYDEDELQLVLYFLEDEGHGCGIYLKENAGFSFDYVSETSGDGAINEPKFTVMNDGSMQYYIYRGYGDLPKYRLTLTKHEDGYIPNMAKVIHKPEIEGELSAEEAMEEASAFAAYNATDAYGIPEEEPMWFYSEESYLESMGFGEAEPLIDYYDEEGKHLITAYYDPTTEIGCSIQTMWDGRRVGYVFSCRNEEKWDGYGVDYMAFTTLDGTDPKEHYGTEESYEELVEYDEEGRVTSFISSVESDITGEVRQEQLLSIQYEYYENGNIKYRHYVSNHMLFATSGSPSESYFDEQGRLVYEWSYITHGSLHDYYVYKDDSDKPSYILYLDDNHDWCYNWVVVK